MSRRTKSRKASGKSPPKRGAAQRGAGKQRRQRAASGAGTKTPASERRSGGRGRRSPLILLLIAGSVVVAVVVAVVPWSGAAPAVVTPRDVGQLEDQFVAYVRPFVERAVENPRDAGTHADLGLVYEANQLWPEARGCYENAAALDDSDPHAAYHLAIAIQELGDLDAALAQLDQVTATFPDFAPGHHRRGDILLELGREEEAEPAFREAVRLAPNEPAALVGLADLDLRRGKHAEAAQRLEQALRISSSEGTTHYLLGLAYQGMGRDDEARRELELGANSGKLYMGDAWTRKLPGHAKGLSRQMRRAIVFMNAGRPAEAARFLEETLAWHPDNVDVMNNLAICYMRQPDLEKARQVLQRALRADAGRYATYVNLAACELRSSNATLALQYADRAVELAPSVAKTHQMRAGALRALQRPAEALVELQEVVRLDPAKEAVLLQLAGLAAEVGDHELARSSYATAAARDPRRLATHVGRVEACLQLGLLDEAAAALQQARQLSPRDPNVTSLTTRLAEARRR